MVLPLLSDHRVKSAFIFQIRLPEPSLEGRTNMTKPTPDWSIPENLAELLDADEDGIWEDDSWDPILLSVMKDTVYRGRPIPLAWQIEFEPAGPGFEAANEKLAALGVDPDGYGWATLIQLVAEKYHPEMAKELQFGDTEESACVVWVESEDMCRQLIQMTWRLINAE
jgi:hypothetical protein